jgi:SLOG cluster2
VPQVQQREKPLDGYLIGLSAGESQDVQAYGLLSRHLDIVFGAIASALVLRGARLAYGGDVRLHGFTQQLYQNVAEAYADDVLLGEGPAAPPFVHYVAASIWANHPQEMETWLASSAGLVEARFMSGDGYLRIKASGGKFTVDSRPGTIDTLSSASEVMQRAKTIAPQNAQLAASLAQMRKAMGRDCDARILLGGKMFDYAGSEPGIPAEARESIAEGAAVLPLGGFGGAARDVAIQTQLMSARPREGPPRGPGYQKVMEEIAGQRALVDARLSGMMAQARRLAEVTDPKEAARLVVEILLGLPKRAARP